MAEFISDERVVQAMQDARMINAVEHSLNPILEQKIMNRILQACAKFRNGETAFVADIAYITGIQDLLQELNHKKLKGNHAIKALDERSRVKK